jgi:hypothetical protein
MKKSLYFSQLYTGPYCTCICYCSSQIRTKICISPGSGCCDRLLHPSFFFYPESGAKIFSTTLVPIYQPTHSNIMEENNLECDSLCQIKILSVVLQ